MTCYEIINGHIPINRSCNPNDYNAIIEGARVVGILIP
jgi:hypothetical protein